MEKVTRKNLRLQGKACEKEVDKVFRLKVQQYWMLD